MRARWPGTTRVTSAAIAIEVTLCDHKPDEEPDVELCGVAALVFHRHVSRETLAG
jgi:hypothetical protein